MTLYRIATDRFEVVPRTTYAAENLLERKDMQRLLRKDLSPLGSDLLLVAEEFGDWEDSKRRIDLLCVNRERDLVVVEIKRTDDGGHMELQAIRYAAMISRMTLEQVIAAYAICHSVGGDEAKATLVTFLQGGDDEPATLSGEVRIILCSADFSTELTTSVLWLNKHELDITCIRLRPYRLGDAVLVDATPIIPLPETADYEVRVREQEKEKRKALSAREEIFRRFWVQLIERSKPRTSLLANRSTTSDHWISAGIGRSGFWLNCALTQQNAIVECFMRVPGGEEKNLEVFQTLLAQKAEIERVFGGALDWQDLPGRQGCRIRVTLPGSWRAAEAEWPEMQDRMIDALTGLEAALKKPILDVRL